MDLINSLYIASSGMEAQGTRLKVTAQNIANVDSTATTPGGDPYRRKTVSFRNMFDRALGVDRVGVRKVGLDRDTPFQQKYDPAHPAANEEGYYQMPNVNLMIEMMDMREAQRSYEANLNVIDVTKRMLQQTLQLLQ